MLSFRMTLCPGPERGVRPSSRSVSMRSAASLRSKSQPSQSLYNEHLRPIPVSADSKALTCSESRHQTLHYQHLPGALVTAPSKGLITPLESALPKNTPINPLQSALTNSPLCNSFRIRTYKINRGGGSSPGTLHPLPVASSHPSCATPQALHGKVVLPFGMLLIRPAQDSMA